MSAARVLVVYYSRTGRTRRIAQAISTALGADLEEIGDRTDRRGTAGYVRSALEALLGASTEIERPERDVASYEVVVVGTPVWYAAVSSPVRTYLWLERDRLPQVAFFLTHGGMGSDRVLGQMSALARKQPIARLVLRAREVESGAHREKVAGFARSLLARSIPARPKAARRVGRRKGRPRR
jgi:flavodoxin